MGGDVGTVKQSLQAGLKAAGVISGSDDPKYIAMGATEAAKLLSGTNLGISMLEGTAAMSTTLPGTCSLACYLAQIIH